MLTLLGRALTDGSSLLTRILYYGRLLTTTTITRLSGDKQIAISSLDNNMQLEKVPKNKVKLLQKICIAAYIKKFAHHWNENGLELYLEDPLIFKGMTDFSFWS